MKVKVVSNSLRPRGLYSPWNSPEQNTGVGSLSLLQGISQPRDQTHVSRIAVDSLPAEPQGKPKHIIKGLCKIHSSPLQLPSPLSYSRQYLVRNIPHHWYIFFSIPCLFIYFINQTKGTWKQKKKLVRQKQWNTKCFSRDLLWSWC